MHFLRKGSAVLLHILSILYHWYKKYHLKQENADKFQQKAQKKRFFVGNKRKNTTFAPNSPERMQL